MDALTSGPVLLQGAGPRGGIFPRLWRSHAARAGIVISAVVLAAAGVAVVWSPYSVSAQGLGPVFDAPSLAHPFGLDASGRDILSRTMGGASIAIFVGIGTSIIATAIGVPLGLVAGYFRGRTDAIISVLINLWYGIPSLLVALLLVVLVGRGLLNIVVAIALTRWMDMARLVRGQALALRQQEFVDAARAGGGTHVAILWRHILPNSLGPIAVQATYLIPQAILFEAFLSYLGLGVQPPTPSWGAMAADGYAALRLAPHVVLAPALAISLTLLAWNWIGDGLRDALDPRTAE